MTTKNNMPNPDEHIHDDDNMEDENSRIITLDMEDGSQKDFIALDIISHEGENYIALSEVGSMDYDVLRFVEVDDSLELSIIEEDDEYEKIAELFTQHFNKLADEAYDDEDEDEENDEDEEE
jgi:hypothetical protein